MTQPDIDLTGIGPHQGFDNFKGWLEFASLPPDVQKAVDQTRHNDYWERSWRASVTRNRDATPVELAMLEHLGVAIPPEGVTVSVGWISSAIRRREFFHHFTREPSTPLTQPEGTP